jgi:hypothetical protein
LEIHLPIWMIEGEPQWPIHLLPRL